MKKAFSRLKSLFQSERGHVLAIGAATLPLLMGSAGFAIDATQMAMWKRQMQRAADSAAIAGAHALVQGAATDPAVANDIDEHIDYDLEDNETPMLKEDPDIDPGIYASATFTACASACTANAVRVSLVAERRLPFMGMFTGSATELNATATAAIVQTGEYCMVSLYEGEDPGIKSGGNSNLALDCGMATNSRGEKAIDAFGSAEIDADPGGVGAVGGISGTSKFSAGTVMMPYSSPIPDPFADVKDPALPDECAATLDIPNGTGTKDAPYELPASAGTCWTNWDIKGHVKLPPGTYFVNNGALDIKGGVYGENVTLVLMGDDSSWTQNGGGKLSLTAPTTGDLAGIVIFRERSAGSDGEGKTVKINGGADLFLQGSIYGKNTDFWIGGNTDISAKCIQVVGRKLEFKGGGSIQNECAGTGAGAFTTRTVRLVA